MRLILASQSPYRRAQLQSLGVKFESHAPKVDESELKKRGPQDLVELTRFLATEKARSLAAEFPGDVILGSDQLADFGGERLDKPGSFENAKAQLKKMSGREHRLITSLALIRGKEMRLHTDVTRITLKELDEDFIEAYLRVDQPYDCAGSYKIEKAGLSLVERLHTEDPSAIQGLPLLSVMRGLEELGLSVEQFWEKK